MRSCHFRDACKVTGPVLVKRNATKLFDDEPAPKKKASVKKTKYTDTPAKSEEDSLAANISDVHHQCNSQTIQTISDRLQSVENIILKAELEQKQKLLEDKQKKENYCREHYSVSQIRMSYVWKQACQPKKFFS